MSSIARICLAAGVAVLLAAAGASAGPASETATPRKTSRVPVPKPGALLVVRVRLRALKPNLPPPKLVLVNKKDLPQGQARRKGRVLGYSVVKLSEKRPKKKSREDNAAAGTRAVAAARLQESAQETTIYAHTVLYGRVNNGLDILDPAEAKSLKFGTKSGRWEIGKESRWGVRGSQDLGSGLSVIYQTLQSGVFNTIDLPSDISYTTCSGLLNARSSRDEGSGSAGPRW